MATPRAEAVKRSAMRAEDMGRHTLSPAEIQHALVAQCVLDVLRPALGLTHERMDSESSSSGDSDGF